MENLDEDVIRSLDVSLIFAAKHAYIRKLNPTAEFAKIPGILGDILFSFSSLSKVQEHLRTSWNERGSWERFQATRSILEAHARVFGTIRIGPNSVSGMLQNLLLDFKRKGYLIDRHQLEIETRKYVGSESGASIPKITAFGIATRNRPEPLKRALESYLGNFKKFDRNPRVIVVDVTPEAFIQNLNREVCAGVSSLFDRKIEYIGVQERNELIEKFSNGDSERRKVLKFCLFGVDGLGHTYGLARNALLLATRGELLFSVDDDSVCTQFRTKKFENKIMFHPKGATFLPQEVHQFWTRDQAKASLEAVDFDVLAAHESVLGQTQGQALLHHLARHPDAQISNLDESVISEIRMNRGPILLSFNAHVGDSGSGPGLHNVLQAGDDTNFKDRWDPDRLKMKITSRELTKASDHIKICADGPCMTIFYGLDNRKALPPFFPHFRLEDLIFKEMLMKIRPDSKLAYVPWALEHSPMEVRPQSSIASVHDTGITTHEILNVIMGESSISGSISDRFMLGREQIAAGIDEFVNLPFDTYKTRLTEAIMERKFLNYSNNKEQFKRIKNNLSRDLSNSVDQYLKSIEKSLCQPLLLADLQSGPGTARQREELSRQMLGQMAEALRFF